MKRQINIFMSLFSGLLCLGAFQNCSPLNSATESSSITDSTNTPTGSTATPPTYGYFVSPQGKPTGDGSIQNPWDFQTALDHPAAVKPGDTIWVRGGTYLGPYGSSLNGTSSAPIKVRAYPGERAIIDGSRTETLTMALPASGQAPCTFSNRVGFTDGDVILVDSEVIYIFNRNGDVFQCIRGWNGTTATAHGVGSIVKKIGAVINSPNDYVWWWGLELTVSRTERIMNNNTYVRSGGLNLTGKGNKAINLIIHNTGHPAIGFWDQGDQGEIYGSIIWGNGIYDNGGSWLRGSGVYTQNQNDRVVIADSIWFRNFTSGISGFGTNSYANGHTVEGNISFDNNDQDIFFGTEVQPIHGLVIKNNYTYRRPHNNVWSVRLGYQASAQDVLIENNYFVGGANPVLTVAGFNQATIRNNSLFGSERLFVFENSQQGSYSSNNNQLYNGQFSYSSPTFPSAVLNLAQWRQQGFDVNSSYVASAPSQNVIAVRPNKYEAGRAHIVIYNWQRLASTSVNLSAAGLSEGQRYQVKDAQNMLGAVVASGTYRAADANSVVLPLTLTQVSPFIGNVTHMTNTHTPTEFNSFVVLPIP